MPKYKIVLERIIEEVIEVEADTEDQAYEFASFEGLGELVDYNEWQPTLVASEELWEPEVVESTTGEEVDDAVL